jgi:phosphoribosylanthranilate isomerase
MTGAVPPRATVKICGLTRPDDAALATRLGADLIGINFWPRSPRYVFDPGRARAITAAASESGAGVRVVGVFVNQEPGAIEEWIGSAGLDLVQLHGDEPDELLDRFAPRALRALRAGMASAAPAGPGVNAVRGGRRRDGLHPLQWTSFAPDRRLVAWILDGPAGARFGGTGEAWDWSQARPLVAAAASPVLIAGGLRPGLARAALAASGAAGVDVASGVESAPGVKDAERMRRLIEEVRGEVG